MPCTRGVIVVIVALAPFVLGLARAENIDPQGSGAKFAYGENVGWISLSCKNTSSCGRVDYGVRNDGAGHLSGRAWSENAGWIAFAPNGAGVSIDPASGNFAGRAWGENAGWMTFAATSPVAYGVTTAWRCVPAPAAPTGSPTLTLGAAPGGTQLAWTGLPGASGFDVVRGDLGALRQSGGNFALAARGCLADNTTALLLTITEAPPAGEGSWFLVRGLNCGGAGSDDEGGASQIAPRDLGIATSGVACP